MQVGTRMTTSSSARQASNAYLLSWVAVAAGGLAYLGVAAARPDLLSIILPVLDQSAEQVIAGRNGSDVADELATLRRWVHDLQHDVAATKSALNDQLQQSQAMSQRLTIAEDRLSPVRDARSESSAKAALQRLQARPPAKAEPPRAALPPSAQTAPQTPPQTQDVAAVAQPQPAAGPAVKVINAAPVSSIVTGSLPETPAVEAAPAGFGPAKVTPAPPAPAGAPRGILIGSSESLEALRSRWGELSARNAGELRELAPRYRLATDGRQAPFSLLAGPFGTNDDAQRTCANLRAKGVTCRVSDYSGSAF